MFNFIKAFWLDILIVVGFIIFTFIYPVKIISMVAAGIITFVCIYAVTHDEERIKDPYASLVALAIFIAYGLFIEFYW